MLISRLRKFADAIDVRLVETPESFVGAVVEEASFDGVLDLLETGSSVSAGDR